MGSDKQFNCYIHVLIIFFILISE